MLGTDNVQIKGGGWKNPALLQSSGYQLTLSVGAMRNEQGFRFAKTD